MDEFDIFMDAVARKVALGKLIDTARSEEMRHRQFIFITPQDLSAVQKHVGDDFKIHKMRPPERADRGLQQTTLN
jgi:structural maintenance of chromosomes protein 6